jgi:predicted TIM-barrel fold metal-dependent hydrolase
MEVIDAQVHLNAVGHQAGLAAMDALGIDGLVIDQWPRTLVHLPNGAVRCTYDFAVEASCLHPARFAFLARPDHGDPGLVQLMTDLQHLPGCVAIRVDQPPAAALRDGAYDLLFATAARLDFPTCVIVPGRVADIEPLIRRHDALQFIIDHAGMPLEWCPTAPRRFAPLDALLELARYPNVAVKWGHVTKLSQYSFPFPDVLDQLARTVDSFGRERVLWESDFTFGSGYETWGESLFSVRSAERFSDDDKAWILGRAARRALRWDRPDDGVDAVLVDEDDWDAFHQLLAGTGRLISHRLHVEKVATDASARPRGRAIGTVALPGISPVSLSEAVAAAISGRWYPARSP